MRRRRLRCGWSGKSRVLSDIRIAERPGIRRSQAMSEVRTIAAGAKRKLPARFNSPLRYTQGEVTSQYLWPRYERHFVGITWHNVWS